VRRERITHYRIERLLGAGGMGEVWAAFDEKLERRVAIKTLPEERASDDARARMLREARAAGALHHPGIVPVFDIGEDDGLTYIVMEWVEGETISERLAANGPMKPADAIALVAQAADALGAAHAAGIVHRDVKAANLMIDARGQVRVLDFGLSKRLGLSHAPTGQMDAVDAVDPDAATIAPDSEDSDVSMDKTLPATPTPSAPGSRSGSRDPVTAFGSRMGTPGYAAPELIAGGDADARSDVFSLAVVLYELVTGERPFTGETWGELERQMRVGPMPPSAASNGAVGPAFDAVIARAFAPRRKDRFATVGELVEAARAAIDAPRPRSRRTTWLLAGGAAVAIAGGAAVVLAGGSSSSSGSSTRAPTPSPPKRAIGAPRPLTSLRGCAEGPIFADDHTVVFDLSRDGAVDLWAVDRDGKHPRAIATSSSWEWRAAPGRTPGEVLYLVTDMSDDSKDAIVAMELATGRETARIDGFASGAAAADGAIYYSIHDGTDIRRRVGGHDESWLTLPPDIAAQQIVVDRGGERILYTSTPSGAPIRLCTVARTGTPSCFEGKPTAGRPELVNGAIYYGAHDGLHRRDPAGADEIVLPGAQALSGVAVAPDRKSLAYSECNDHVQLVDPEHPEVALVDDSHPSAPTLGPHGELAWVHQDLRGSTLVVRRTDGTTVEVVPPSFGRISFPAFDDRGDHLVFLAGGKHPGIHIATTMVTEGEGPKVTQLTDGAADYDPYFLRDGRVVFTRVDDRNIPHVFVVSADGGAPAQMAVTSRAAQAINHATGELLVTAGEHLVWWNPITDHMSAPLAGTVMPRNLTVSPNGKWMVVQTGSAGLTFWRGPTDDPTKLVKIAELPSDETVDAAAIGDDGKIIAAVSVWRGELEIVDGSF